MLNGVATEAVVCLRCTGIPGHTCQSTLESFRATRPLCCMQFADKAREKQRKKALAAKSKADAAGAAAPARSGDSKKQQQVIDCARLFIATWNWLTAL